MKLRTIGISLVLFATGSILSVSVAAEEEPYLEEIVVTAQKRSQNQQDVPISIAAVDQEKLRASGVTGFTGLSVAAPSLNVATAGQIPTLFIRGVGAFNTNAATYSSVMAHK